MTKHLFTCNYCDTDVPVSELSKHSRRAVRKAKAKLRTYPAVVAAVSHLIVCRECDMVDEEAYTMETDGSAQGRTETERWAFSGVVLDRATLDRYLLNY